MKYAVGALETQTGFTTANNQLRGWLFVWLAALLAHKGSLAGQRENTQPLYARSPRIEILPRKNPRVELCASDVSPLFDSGKLRSCGLTGTRSNQTRHGGANIFRPRHLHQFGFNLPFCTIMEVHHKVSEYKHVVQQAPCPLPCLLETLEKD